MIQRAQNAAVHALLRRSCHVLFQKMDVDSNGRIDQGELYVGVLLCYSKINQVTCSG